MCQLRECDGTDFLRKLILADLEYHRHQQKYIYMNSKTMSNTIYLAFGERFFRCYDFSKDDKFKFILYKILLARIETNFKMILLTACLSRYKAGVAYE